MKKVQTKMEELECSQDFPHDNPMGATCCMPAVDALSQPILVHATNTLNPRIRLLPDLSAYCFLP